MHGENKDDTGLVDTAIGNRYRVLECIGEGAMGSVYLADDLQLHRRVALKVLRREWLQRVEVRKRLEHECRIMARLGPHPHIVTLFDRLEHEGNAVLVMEYVKGKSLDKLLDTRRKELDTDTGKRETRIFGGNLPQVVLDTTTVLEIAIQCLNALAFAHSKYVVHRDIKPSNVMISVDHNGRIEAKLMDFGIGKLLDDGDESWEPEAQLTSLTLAGGPGPGTPAYMAPEQIDPLRFGTVGPQADLYSFGVMLFELLTCHLPFKGSYTELLHAHTNIEPPDPAAHSGTLSPMIIQLLQRSLRKTPSERFPSAEAFLAEIKAFVEGRGAVLPGPYPGSMHAQQSSPQHSGHQRPLLVGLLVLAVVFIGGSGFLLLGRRTGPEKKETLDTVSAPDSSTKEHPDVSVTRSDEVQASEQDPDGEESLELQQARREVRDAKKRAEDEFARIRETPHADNDYRQGEELLVRAEAATARGEPQAALSDYEKASLCYSTAVKNAEKRLEDLELKATEALSSAEAAEQAAKSAFDEAQKSISENANFTQGNSKLASGRAALNAGDYSKASECFLSARRCFDQARPAPLVQASQPEPVPKPQPEPEPEPASVTARTPASKAPTQNAPGRAAENDRADKAAEENRRLATELAIQALGEATAAKQSAVARFEAQNYTQNASKTYLEAEKILQEAAAAAKRGDFTSAQGLAERSRERFNQAKPPEAPIIR
ncbi:MAG: protein kinase [Phycisphaerales bacterium]|nr:protein kinase [Phycisphaerales bacterium]